MTNKIKINKYSWTIPNVNYKNKIYIVDLLKEPLDNGKSHIQDEWAEYSNTHDFKVPDMPLYYAIFNSIFNQKEGDIREFIKSNMRNKFLVTLTRPIYKPRGKDKIIHNYHTPEEYTLEENIVGKDRFIERADSNALKALLGTGDINKINETSQYINETNAYLFRLNKKPDRIIESVAGFGAYSDGVCLGCDRNPQSSDSALGAKLVREAPKNFPQEELLKSIKNLVAPYNQKELEKRINQFYNKRISKNKKPMPIPDCYEKPY